MPIGPWKILRDRDYAFVWVATALGSLGTWMQIGALGIYVTESTGQARWTGIASTVTYVGFAVLMPIGGVLADRYDRRSLIAVIALAQALVLAVMSSTFAAGIESPPLLIGLSGTLGLLSAASSPSLFAMVADIVPENRLANATLLDQIGWNAGRAAGPAVAVAIVHSYSYAAVFAVDAVFCLVLAATMPLLRTKGNVRVNNGSVLNGVRVAWRGIRQRNMCKWPIMLSIIDMAMIAPYVALVPVMGVLVLDAGPEGTAALFTAQGLGSIAGSLIVGSVIHRFGQGRSVVAMSCALPFVLTAYALSPTLLFAILAIAPLSALHTSVFAVNSALVQQAAGRELRARTIGISSAITNISYASVSTTLGVVADGIGLRPTLLLAAGAAGLLLLAMATINVNRLAAVADPFASVDPADPADKRSSPEIQESASATAT